MKPMGFERWLYPGLILSGLVCSWAAVPAQADEWSKTYYPDRQARSAGGDIRRRHSRLHLGAEHH